MLTVVVSPYKKLHVFITLYRTFFIFFSKQHTLP